MNKSAQHYIKAAEKLHGAEALRALRHAQNDLMGETPPDLENWKALESKIARIEIAQAAGRKGGSVSSPAKTRAVKINAQKAGRPPSYER